jgi:hypothetical protein
MSGNSWANMGQQCEKCLINVYPYRQVRSLGHLASSKTYHWHVQDGDYQPGSHQAGDGSTMHVHILPCASPAATL